MESRVAPPSRALARATSPLFSKPSLLLLCLLLCLLLLLSRQSRPEKEERCFSLPFRYIYINVFDASFKREREKREREKEREDLFLTRVLCIPQKKKHCGLQFRVSKKWTRSTFFYPFFSLLLCVQKRENVFVAAQLLHRPKKYAPLGWWWCFSRRVGQQRRRFPFWRGETRRRKKKKKEKKEG